MHTVYIFILISHLEIVLIDLRNILHISLAIKLRGTTQVRRTTLHQLYTTLKFFCFDVIVFFVLWASNYEPYCTNQKEY